MIETFDSRYINFPVAAFTAFNSLVWCIYGFLSQDTFIFLSQFINLQAGLVQIIFYLWATKKISSSHFIVKNLIMLFRLRSNDVLPRFLASKRRVIRNGIEMTPTKIQREKEKLTDESDISTYNTLESDNISLTSEAYDLRSQTSKAVSRKVSMESEDLVDETESDSIKILDNSEIQIRILA